jgi:hypothetical protein
MFRVRALTRPLTRTTRAFSSSYHRTTKPTFRIPVIPFAAAAFSTTTITMAPVPAKEAQQAVQGSAAELNVVEPKSGGEKSKKMHSQVVIIGSGPAGHT